MNQVESAAIGSSSPNEPVLEVRRICKSFPGVRALHDVDFDVRAGEIHALCGENGAGKSTLMKILAGNQTPDSGEMRHGGARVEFQTPLDAKRRGILLIHQEISLVAQLSIAENIFLGALPRTGAIYVAQKKLAADAAAALRACGYNMQVDQRVGELSIAHQQMVELARAAAFQCSVVVFDEPTASLTEAEAQSLFENIRRLKREGVGIVYVSHKLKEIFALSDRITILRDGEVRGVLATKDTSEAELTRLMIGRSLSEHLGKAQFTPGAEALRVEGLSVSGYVDEVSFSVRQGEILGLYGLVGAGRSEAAEAIFGLRAKTGGKFLWKGQPVDIRSARDAVELGIALVPEDRKRQGLILEMPARENISLALLRRLSRWGVLQRGRERSLFHDYAQRLRIKVANDSAKAATLSGGNQQKVVLAKWIATNPRLLILDEPTRGVDVGAKAEIYAIIIGLAELGMAVILISSEMPEIISLSHRVVTMYRGHVTDEVRQVDISEERLVAGAMNRNFAPRPGGQPRQATQPPGAAE